MGANVDAKDGAAVARTISHVRKCADVGDSVATIKLSNQGSMRTVKIEMLLSVTFMNINSSDVHC